MLFFNEVQTQLKPLLDTIAVCRSIFSDFTTKKLYTIVILDYLVYLLAYYVNNIIRLVLFSRINSFRLIRQISIL